MGSRALPRIAVLIPFAPRGWYWHPLLAELARRFPGTTVFSCLRSEVPLPYRGTYSSRFAGPARKVALFARGVGPGISMTMLPVGIIAHLLRFRPHVIFTSGFSLWSVLSLMMGALVGTRVIIVYDGSSPKVDYLRRSFRIALRRLMSRQADAIVTNTQAGKRYLVRELKAPEHRVFSRPYLVPSTAALSALDGAAMPVEEGIRRPVFLFVGRVSSLKGIGFLLDACAELVRRGRRDFSLLVVGTGPEEKRWRERSRSLGLQDIVRWEGKVEYGRLGGYYRSADVFILPTLTDVWGMVVLEAMAFGNPVICSRWAGAAEIVSPNESGFLVDPYRPGELASLMERFIEDPALAPRMGSRSREILARHDPRSAIDGLAEVVRFVTSRARVLDSSSRTRIPRRSCRSR